MGLYNYVNFTMPCPNCGSSVDEFQTKEIGDAGAVRMHVVAIESVKILLGQCPHCRLYIELDRSHMGEGDE